MDPKKLVESLNEIEMPKEMKERIIRNCYIEMEENTMSKNKSNIFLRKPMVAVASLALCFCLTGITALATTGKLQGFFKDIVRFDGAVIGTTYDQATDEIEMSAVTEADELMVSVTLLNPKNAPYSAFETFGIESYKIIDMAGNVVTEGKATDMTEIIDGKATISIPIDTIKNGTYKLVINKFIGSKKADQPLIISGAWEFEFTR